MSVFGDIYGIAERVKEIDPLLVISYNEQNRKYTVSRGDHNIMEVASLDARILARLRKGDLQRRRLEDYIRELEHSEDLAEQSRARALRNKIESITLDKFDRLVDIKHFSLGGI